MTDRIATKGLDAARRLLFGAAMVCWLCGSGCVLAQGITFSVGPDESLTYPSNLTDLADEHTTIFRPGQISNKYVFFASSGVKGATGGAVVLETSNLKDFFFADGYATQVMTPAIAFSTCKDDTYDPEFDLNYAAPGSVVQDPTLPPGNFIMIYEAENHCPGAHWQHDFYATVGLARSSDYGKTWPAPVDSELGGDDRYPVLKNPVSEPTMPENPQVAIGNALPSAIVGQSVGADRGAEYYLYIVYNAPGPTNDGMLRIARARLGVPGRLQFAKWYNEDFSEPGIQGVDSAVLPSRGCTGRQDMGQISYSDILRLYVMVFVCVDVQAGVAYQAGWWYSTATDLDLEDWTPPQPIENSERPIVNGCANDGTGQSFDGWYPSLMSPGVLSGRISITGRIFFMSGCDRGQRQFVSRRFKIAPP
jgi:hypothetical protein